MPKTKVTPEIAQDIKAAHARGLMAKDIAEEFGLHIRTVWRTIAGENCKPKRAIEDRFWEKVDVRGPRECHLWKAGKNPNGYGVFGIWADGKTDAVLAHRFAYEAKYGPVDPGLEVIHSCDTPACVNWRHLRAGSHQENMNDMLKRKRHAYGTVNGKRGQNSLNPEKVERIRILYAAGMSQMALAREFGVSGPTIWYVATGQRWVDAPGPITPMGTPRKHIRHGNTGRKRASRRE